MARPYKKRYGEDPSAETVVQTPEEAPVITKADKKVAKEQVAEASGDLVDIWERRMLNPMGQTTQPIRIKTPGMRLRWINLASRGRYQRARYEQGWVPVEKRELVDEREIYGVSYTNESFVCRGEKQQEMLMKIPVAVFKKIQSARTAANKRSYQHIKDSIAQSGATHFADKYDSEAGARAADAVGQFKGSIAFGTETVPAEDA
ncbi:MAG: hypothetical protein NUW01_06675 [Gemmatimonadaceae bacterium]|nr:hypothetical protein [Gemmatimonadaceae bacterium]